MAKKVKTSDMIKVLVVYSSDDADEIDMRLRMERIPCVRQKIGAGNHGNILLAMNNFGEEIFVDPELETQAREVIEQWRADKKKAQEENAQSDKEEEKKEQNKTLPARIFAGVVVVIAVVLYLVNR